MKELLMTIGLPFSGKSTLAEDYAQKGWEVIRRDELLPEIIHSPEFEAEVAKRKEANVGKNLFAIKNEVAVEMLSARVRALVRDSSSERIFYDGTNLQAASRAGILELTKEGVMVDAVLLRVPLEEILNRALVAAERGDRKDAFNAGAIEGLRRMLRMAEDPEEGEGFRHIDVREFTPEPNEIRQSEPRGFEIKNK